MASLGGKFKRQETLKKTTLQTYYSDSIQKTTRKNTQKESGHFAKAIVEQNGQLRSEIKRSKNMQKTALQAH